MRGIREIRDLIKLRRGMIQPTRKSLPKDASSLSAWLGSIILK